MSIETEAGMDEFPADVMVPSPIEQIDQLIEANERAAERHDRNLKASKELLKRLRAVRKTMERELDELQA
jgi:hypothetical protein